MAIVEKYNTDDLLANSFKELVKHRPVEKITIQEITDGAGVIRPTFYNHFKDKYELLEWIIREDLLEPVRPLLRNHMVREALMFLFRNMEREKEFYSQIVKLEGQNSFESIAQNSFQEVLLEGIAAHAMDTLPKYEWLTPEWMAAYYAQSICYVAINWIKGGFQESGKELAEVCSFLTKSQ